MAFENERDFKFVRYHVVPGGESHIFDPVCDCNPYLTHKFGNGNELWTHRRINKLSFSVEGDLMVHFNF